MVNSALTLYLNMLQSFYYLSKSILHNISIYRDVYFFIIKRCCFFFFNSNCFLSFLYQEIIIAQYFRAQKPHVKSLKTVKSHFFSYCHCAW